MRLIALFLLLLNITTVRAEAVITPDEVYAQALLIEKETELIERQVKPVTRLQPWQPVQAEILPRHVWMEFYMLQMKIIAFRVKEGMPKIYPVDQQPMRDLDSSINWLQAKRVQTEVNFLRKRLGIAGDVGAAPQISGKKSLDVYNKLAEIQTHWDELLGGGFNPSMTFAQVMRLNEDVNLILHTKKIFDIAIPPSKKPDATAKDTMEQVFLVLEQVQRLQRAYGLSTVDFTPFRHAKEITSNHVFNMVCLTLAEEQLLKAQMGLTDAFMPPASYFEGKTSGNVVQFLGYVANKLRLINTL